MMYVMHGAVTQEFGEPIAVFDSKELALTAMSSFSREPRRYDLIQIFEFDLNVTDSSGRLIAERELD